MAKVCKECGADSSAIKAKDYDIPFYCEKCGAIKFKYTPINGTCFIYPIYKYSKTSAESSIIAIPEFVVKRYKTKFGIVLGASPTYRSKKLKKLIHNPGIEKGDKVCYDSDVPWGDMYKGNDGKSYGVMICNLVDVWAKVQDE